MARKEHTLFEDFEYRGHWYLPENPEQKVAGVVRFDSERGICLELFQSFPEPLANAVERVTRPRLILGLSDNGTPITLFQATQTGWVAPGAEKPAFYYAQYMFLGHHFHARSDILFSSLSVNFTYLEEWMGHANFEPRSGPNMPSYSAPDEVKGWIRQIGPTDAEITVHSTLRSNGDWLRSMETVHTGWLKITPGESQDFAWYRKVLDSLQNLMTLLMGRPVYPKLVTSRVGTGEFYEWSPSIEKVVTAEVYFHQEFRTPTPPRRSHHQSAITEDVLLPLPSIAPDLSIVLNAWFKDVERLDPVHEVFFGALYNTRAYPQSQFLSLMQAAESLHRRTRFGKYVREEKYEEYRREMVACIPGPVNKDHRESLKARLKYGNEYALRKRLQELLRLYPGKELIEANPNFINDIVNTRNYLTHLTDELKDKALHGTALLKANDDLRYLLTILLLRRLEISGATVYEASLRIERSEYLSLED